MTDIANLACPCGRTFTKPNSFGLHSRYCDQATPAVRFWANVDKSAVHNGCWIFTGFIKWDGYGWLNRNGRNMTAHRYAWILTHGEPQEGAHILHQCDVPACCNPDHLRLGTHRENMAEMMERGRHNSSQIKKYKPVLHPHRVRPRRAA